MEQITYDSIINILLEKFPEYKNSERYFDESNKELQYIVLGNLSLMAFEDLDKKTDIRFAKKLIKFTDDIINNSNSSDELINLFQIEVFEQLVGSRTGAKLAKQLLHGKSIELLQQTMKNYNTEEFLEEYRKSSSS